MASQQSTFKTIAVQGQKPVIAETPSDTLHIIPGDNVEITSDPSTDTLRISVKDVTEGKGYLNCSPTSFCRLPSSSRIRLPWWIQARRR
jgi:hypothetical protein